MSYSSSSSWSSQPSSPSRSSLQERSASSWDRRGSRDVGEGRSYIRDQVSRSAPREGVRDTTATFSAMTLGSAGPPTDLYNGEDSQRDRRDINPSGHETESSPDAETNAENRDTSLHGTPNQVPESHTSPSRSSRDIVLPQWQPDASVSQCPICNRPFTFFFRKHHCRKCGRVVCALCSPHRITIPRQFIVHPPAESNLAAIAGEPSTDPTGAQSGSDHAGDAPAASPAPNRTGSTDLGLGGGAEVRICNPCVPDPNTAPPPQINDAPRYPDRGIEFTGDAAYTHPARLPAYPGLRTRSGRAFSGSSALNHPYRAYNPGGLSAQDQFMGLGAHGVMPFTGADDRPNITGRRRSVRFADPSTHSPSPSTSAPTRSSMFQPSTPPTYTPRGRRHRPSPSLGGEAVYGQHGVQPSSMLYVPESQASDTSRPQRPLREEDYCPVCHAILPPKGPDGDETQREAHIEECVSSHFSGMTGSAPTEERPLPPDPPPAVDEPVTSTASASATPPPQPQPASTTRPRRSTGTGNRMFTYTATEKDCIATDGPGGETGDLRAECVICFEEFEPGADMARLECLCKFHRSCIRSWWNVKGGGCPVHQESQ